MTSWRAPFCSGLQHGDVTSWCHKFCSPGVASMEVGVRIDLLVWKQLRNAFLVTWSPGAYKKKKEKKKKKEEFLQVLRFL